MSRTFPSVDPEGLLEYSVVFTDRAVNHMSQHFQQAMREVVDTLKEVYQAEAAVVVPGGGSVGMESVARQLATGQKVLVIRNGWFSYRWTQIFETGGIPSQELVLKAARQSEAPQAPWAPPAIEAVEAAIAREQPGLVFAAHVETASGIVLPDAYLQRLAAAVHAHGGLLVVDSVASGALWLDMRALGIDVLITAPQKGWSSAPGVALVMLGAEGLKRVENTRSTSFAADLNKWLQIVRAYEGGGHAYHSTLPTSVLLALRDAMRDTRAFGFDAAREAQWALGRKVRALLADAGFPSVAADGYAAPGVVVSYTDDVAIHNASAFAAQGLQTAAGVPLMCDEPQDFRSFRVGLFGLDKLADVDGAVQRLAEAVANIRQG